MAPDISNLPPRRLIRDGEFSLNNLQNSEFPLKRYILLYSDLLIIAKPFPVFSKNNSPSYALSLEHMIPLQFVWTSEMQELFDLNFYSDAGFLLGWPSEESGVSNIVAMFKDSQEKIEWFNLINDEINKLRQDLAPVNVLLQIEPDKYITIEVDYETQISNLEAKFYPKNSRRSVRTLGNSLQRQFAFFLAVKESHHHQLMGCESPAAIYAYYSIIHVWNKGQTATINDTRDTRCYFLMKQVAKNAETYRKVTKKLVDETDSWPIFADLPPEILNRSTAFVEEYKRACIDGSVLNNYFRLMIVGPEGVGKTSLLKALRNQPFEESEFSTDYIEKTDITMTDLSNDWCQNVCFKDRLKEARDDSLAQHAVKSFKYLSRFSEQLESNDCKTFSPKLSPNLSIPSDTESLNKDKEEEFYDSKVSNSDIKSTLPTIDLLGTNLSCGESISKTGMSVYGSPVKDYKFVTRHNSLVEREAESVPENSEDVPSDLPRIQLNSDKVNSDHKESIHYQSEVLPYLQSEDLPVRHIKKHWNRKAATNPMEFFTVWDLAGQSYLFCMHSMFLSPRAVYLMPVDLSVSLDAKVTLRERDKGRLGRREIKDKTYLEITQYWVQTIYSVAKSNENGECRSRIIIVFTKSDKIRNPAEIAKNYFKTIEDSLTWKSNCMSIVDREYHVVSAKMRSIVTLKLLKKSIDKNAELTCFNHPLPIRWLEFALKIISHRDPIVGEATYKEVARDTGCTVDYVEILQLFHSIGLFFFRKNILIKSISNLLDIILRITSPSYCYDLVPLPKYFLSPQRKLLKHIEKAEIEGTLSNDVLTLILKHNNLLELKTEIVQLLMEYGILLSKQKTSTEYLIPYLFTGDLSQIYYPQQNDLIIFLYFPDELIPTSFYFAFLSRCLKQVSRVETTRSVPKFAFDCVAFQWIDKITWIIDFTEHQPYIRIILQGIDFSKGSPNIYSIIFQIEEWIVQIQQELIITGNLMKIVLDCPCGSFMKLLRPCVYFETFRKCAANNMHFYCKTNQLYYPWSFFNRHIKPFSNIPPEIGQKFLDEHYDVIVKTLDWKSMLEFFYEKGLIEVEERAKIQLVEGTKKTGVLLQSLPNKGKDWVNVFYKYLNSLGDKNKTQSHFESFILKSFKSKNYGGIDLCFARYPILHNPFGICLIINIKTFDNLPERRGSNKDFTNLKDTFEKMNFNIYEYQDLTESEFLNTLEVLRTLNYSALDTFFCVIMSHGGEDDVIYTKDECEIKKEYIIDLFTPNKCEGLAGKPKVFIFQSCRGELQDKGIHVKEDEPPSLNTIELSLPESDSNSPKSKSTKFVLPPPQRPSKKVATYSDIYIAQASVKGHISYRHTTEGSIFINNFCSVMNTARFNYHFGDIMVEVRRKVSDTKVRSYVQCPEDTNTLTKQLFLF